MSADPNKLKDDFQREHGEWTPGWESLLRLDTDFFEAYLSMSTVPHRRQHLSPKVREFCRIAASAAATHLYVPGIRHHIRIAIELGATVDEIMEVLELTATLGIHAVNIGVPLLLEVLEEEGLAPEDEPLTGYQEQVKEEFISNRGYWHPFWEGVLRLDPEFLDAYMAFSSVPWQTGSLEPKTKELIYCAFDAAATHMFQPGLKLHIRNALKYGATKEEIMEVFEIVSTIGIHGPVVAAPILEEEWETAQA